MAMTVDPDEAAKETIVTSDELVRARCEATGAVAALSKRALDYGAIPGWCEVAGPVPTEHKPAAFPPKETPKISGGKPGTEQSAGGTSAKTKEQ